MLQVFKKNYNLGTGIVINGNVISATGGGGGGGTDNYEALDNKPQINGVTLIGNKTFQDLGLNFPTKTVWHEPSDYSNVDIDTNLLFDLTNTSIGDEIPNWEVASNTKVYCMKWDSLPSQDFRVSGRCSNVMWAIVDGYPYFSIGNKTLIDKSEVNLQYSDQIISLTEFTLQDTSDYYVLFQFTDTAFDTPSLKVASQEIDFGTDYNDLDNKPTINGVTLEGDLTSGDLHIGSNAKYLETNVFLIDGTTLSLDTGFYYTDSFQVYRTNTSEIVVGQYQLFYFDNTKQYLWTPNKFYIYYEGLGGWASSNNSFVENSLSNSQDKIPSSYAVYNALLSGIKAQTLGSNVVLNSDGTTTPELESGLYISGVHTIGVSGQTPLISEYQLFYYNKQSDLFFSDNTFYTGAFQYTYDSGSTSWIIVRNDFLENTLTNDSTLIPTSQAVYQAIQNIPSGSSFYTELDYSLHLQNDGTIIDDDGFSVTLTTGYYKFINDNKIAIDPVNYDATKNSIFYYDSTGNAFEFFTNTSTNYKWAYIGFKYSSGSWKDYTDRFVTTLPSSGDNDDIPTNKAVRDYVDKESLKISPNEAIADTTSGYYYINYQTAQNGNIYFIKFPTITTSNNAYLSIDNKTTYYPLIWEDEYNSPVKSKYLSNQIIELEFNGTYFIGKNIDTGWITPTYHTSFTSSSLVVRRKGNIVNWNGQASSSSNLSGSYNDVATIEDSCFSPGSINKSSISVGQSSATGKVTHNYSSSTGLTSFNIVSVTGSTTYLRGDITYMV